MQIPLAFARRPSADRSPTVAKRANYGFEKRQKEINRQKKRDEKEEKKRLKKELAAESGGSETGAETDDGDEGDGSESDD